MKNKDNAKIMGWATPTTPASPATNRHAKVQAKPNSKPLYDVVAARQELTDADYEYLNTIVPQGKHVVRDADEPWSCE